VSFAVGSKSQETFHSHYSKENETRTNILSGVKTFLLCFGGKTFGK
jgi:hypothetical protein